MDMKYREREINQVIEEAIQTFPLATTPEGLLAKVMAAVEKPAKANPFPVSWMDVSFSALLAIITGIVLELLQQILRTPYGIARLKMQTLFMSQSLRQFLLHNRAEVIAVLVGMGAMITLTALVTWIYRRGSMVIIGATI